LCDTAARKADVLVALEVARNLKQIGGGLEARVTIAASEPAYSVLAKYRDQLRYLFIVSAVTLKPWMPENGATGGIKVNVDQADGAKCERCWNYSIHVGEDAVYPTVCERCGPRLKRLEMAASAI